MIKRMCGAALIGLLLALSGLVASPAQAFEPGDEADSASERSTAMDDRSKLTPAQIEQSKASTQAAYVLLQNVATRNCMDDSQAYGLRMIPCIGNQWQSWELWGTSGFRNAATGKCLDDSDAYGLRTYPCNGTTFQAWKQIVYPSGTSALRNYATGRCLDDSSHGLRTYPCNSTDYQGWWFYG